MGQSLLSKYIILPSYLKVSTFSITCTHAHSYVPTSIWMFVVTRYWCFFPIPLLHIVLPRFPVAISPRGMNMLHCSHRGWGAGPSLRTTIFSFTYRCVKFKRRFMRIVDLPVKTSTRQFMSMAVRGNATRYSLGAGSVSWLW